MSSTHLSLHYHLVFGTKSHQALITSTWRDRLHAYLGGVIRTLDGVPEAIGGVADHVHLLVSLRATHTLADVLRELKSVSSKWAHEEMGVRSFAWQEGYGAFTVSASQSDATGFIRLNALRLKLHAQTRDSEIPPPSASLV